MEVSINTAKCDQGTERIAEIVRPHLQALSEALCGEFGGPMEHLWIDLELSPGDADHRPAFPFRFQKRVAPSRGAVSLGVREKFNVGHYSVRPDYFALAQVPLDDLPCWLMSLLYESTEFLKDKEQLAGFDVDAFRSQFLSLLRASGCATKPCT